MSRIRYALAIGLAATNTACWLKKKPAVVAVPPIPTPQPSVPAPAPVEAQPPPVISEPPPASAGNQEQPLQDLPPVEIPPVQPPPRPKPAAPKRPATTPAQTPAMPKLGPMMSQEQQVQLATSYDKERQYARSVLTSLRGRTLSQNQSENANRVRAFLRQAEDLRERDLPTAAQLAHRAALMAQDLERSLR